MKFMSDSSICTNVLVCAITFKESERSADEIDLSVNYFSDYGADICKYVSKCEYNPNDMNYIAVCKCLMKFIDGKLYRIIVIV